MDFNIRPISKTCAVSGEPLEPGADCWSVLREVEGRLVREDYSVDNWEGPPERAVGFWKCQVPASADAGPQILDADALLHYFVQLCESPNEAEADYQYVLALLLLRKKRLVLDETLEIDDQPAMRLIGTAGEGPFDVVERDLSDEQIAIFQDQLFGRSTEAA